MKNKKIAFILLSVVLLTGCAQSSAFIGPAITVAATGNVAQAGFTYGTNEAIKRETGKDTMQYVSSLLEPKEKKVTINEDFIALVEGSIKKTRQKLIKKKVIN
tara:strand:- start:1183 stop:1491 length:309 start_codon:yes stop_codon:yes gene_type:complete